MPQNLFQGEVAKGYDAVTAAMIDPTTLGATVEVLSDLAPHGPALELGIGTGRIAIPLAAAGVAVAGIDISADMLDLLRAKPGARDITVAHGDFATEFVGDDFSLLYVVYNSISCLLEQDEWVGTFVNAARHLRPGGRFLVELFIPDLRRFPPGAAALPFHVDTGHLGFDTLDPATQRGTSHLYLLEAGAVQHVETPFRYAWPAELDLMARLAGMTLLDRWADWDRTPFTSESTKSISVWQLDG